MLYSIENITRLARDGFINQGRTIAVAVVTVSNYARSPSNRGNVHLTGE